MVSSSPSEVNLGNQSATPTKTGGEENSEKSKSINTRFEAFTLFCGLHPD